MTAGEAVRKTRAHIEGQFPKTCPTCRKVFTTLADYLIETQHIGPPVSYDAEAGDWTPKMPLGTMSMANCRCGTTLNIGSGGMSIWTLWRLMKLFGERYLGGVVGFESAPETWDDFHDFRLPYDAGPRR